MTRPQDDSTDPQLRELIYRPGTIIRLREQGGDWVWDVFIRPLDGDQTRLGLPLDNGQLYPLLVMENLGRNASPFLIVSLCAQACSAGATVTTATTELHAELSNLVRRVTSQGLSDGDIRYRLNKKLTRKRLIAAPGAVVLPDERTAATPEAAPGHDAAAGRPSPAHVSRSKGGSDRARRRSSFAPMDSCRG